MRILILAPQWPDPPRQGAAIRNLQIARYLAQRHRVTLLTFAPDGPLNTSPLAEACERVEILPLPTRSTFSRLRTLALSPLPDMAWRLYSPAMHELVSRITAKTPFDAIHIEGIEMAPYALKTQNSKLKTQNFTYDAHNAEYLLQHRAFTTDLLHPTRLPKALYSLVQWLRLRRFERRVCRESAHVISVSDADRAALARLSHDLTRRITVLPNGVDPAYWSRKADYGETHTPLTGDTLVFDGTMDFRPNVDAVLWFAQEVWPRIRVERPHCRFFIVGRNPSAEVCDLGKTEGITVTGAVEDPRPWVAGATVYVVPMRMGGGVRLKLLQAMSMGCAIVSTPMGAEGVSLTPGQEMLIARSPQEFARATLTLLADKDRRRSLGSAARRLATQQYAWHRLLPTLDALYPVREHATPKSTP